MNKKAIQREHNALYVWDNTGEIIDRNGYPVDTKGDIWELNHYTKTVRINWGDVKAGNDLKDVIQAYTAHEIESHASTSAQVTVIDIKYCLSKIPYLNTSHELTFSKLESALTQMREDGRPWRFNSVRVWYRWCCDQRVPGFSDDILKRLYELRIPNRPKCLPVTSRDPKKGPLDDQEYWMVRQALKTGTWKIMERVYVMLFQELGARPVQIALLEERDFRVWQGSDGRTFYSLDVPRVKQRTISTYEKKTRRISNTLGRAIEELIEYNHKRYGNQGTEMPLLCSNKNKNTKKLPEPLKSRYSLHLRNTVQRSILKRFVRLASIKSARTDTLLHLTPVRLRYTLARRLLEMGAPASLISELLDHTSTESIQPYVSSSSSAVERLNSALGDNEDYAAVINSFLGVIKHRTGAEDPHTIIFGDTPTFKNLGGIGACGAGSLCGLYPPLSCYVCPKFQAWSDGPHSKMLQELEDYNVSLAKRTGNPTDRIPHQLGEVIAAIKALLRKLQEFGTL
jgi:hypothetical protein